jgi:hypothetical protein
MDTEDSTSRRTDMSVRRERGHTHMRESAEQGAFRIALGESRAATLAEGQRFTTAARTITPAAIAFVDEGSGRYRQKAPVSLVLGYALGLVPLVDERIAAVRASGDVAFERAARIGDSIHIEASVDEVEPLDDESDIAHMTCDVVNQRTERVGHINVDALVDRRSGQTAACREQDFVKKESAAAVPG